MTSIEFNSTVTLSPSFTIKRRSLFSTQKVGGLRFVKIGRLCFSFCIMKGV